MKILVCKDKSKLATDPMLWLVYSTNSKQFHIELPQEASPLNIPMPLDAFYKRDRYSIDMKTSLEWVRMRIVPPDRQNIAYILKQVNIPAYDEFSLLVYNNGRCSQDEYYLTKTKEEKLPEYLRARLSRRVKEIMPLSNSRLIVFFLNGETKICDLGWKIASTPSMTALRNDENFKRAAVQEDGFSVHWGDNEILYPELYSHGVSIPLTLSDIETFVQLRVMDTSDAAEYLHCTAQNINAYRHRGKITPVKTTAKYNLYRKAEIEKLLGA